MEGRVDVIGNKEHRSKRSPSQALLSHCFLTVCHFVTLNHYKEHLKNCSAFAFSFHNNLQPCFLSQFLERLRLLQIRSVLDPHDFHSSLLLSRAPSRARSVRCPHTRGNSCFIIYHLLRARRRSQTWKMAVVFTLLFPLKFVKINKLEVK